MKRKKTKKLREWWGLIYSNPGSPSQAIGGLYRDDCHATASMLLGDERILVREVKRRRVGR